MKTDRTQGLFNSTRSKILCSMVLFLTWTGSALSQSESQGRWFSRSPLPTPRQEMPHAVLNGLIYVAGGLITGGAGSNVVEVFNPVTDTWMTAPPLPEPLHHLGVAVAKGKLYVLGGYVGSSFSPTNRVYEYDPSVQQWTQKAPMLVPRGAHVAVEHSGKIFVFGGVSSGVVVNATEVYDPATDIWQSRQQMPTPREHLAAALLDSLIYVVGGRVGGQNTNTLEAYSPLTDTWYPRQRMPTARGGLAAAAMGGRLYAFGGEIPGVYRQNEEYDPIGNSWREMAPLPTPRHGIGAATVGDSIYVIGGAAVQGFGVTDVNEVFTLGKIVKVKRDVQPVERSIFLYQNYPNPFSLNGLTYPGGQTTIIQFDVPEEMEIRLAVFDLLGRGVASLVEGERQPGSYSVRWDGRDTRGMYVASGAYLCRLVGRGYFLTRMMVVIR